MNQIGKNTPLRTHTPLLTFFFSIAVAHVQRNTMKSYSQIITNDIIKAGNLSWSQAQKWSRLGVALQGLPRLVDRNGTSNNMNCWQGMTGVQLLSHPLFLDII